MGLPKPRWSCQGAGMAGGDGDRTSLSKGWPCEGSCGAMVYANGRSGLMVMNVIGRRGLSCRWCVGPPAIFGYYCTKESRSCDNPIEPVVFLLPFRRNLDFRRHARSWCCRSTPVLTRPRRVVLSRSSRAFRIGRSCTSTRDNMDGV